MKISNPMCLAIGFVALSLASAAHATIFQISGSLSAPYTGGPVAVLTTNFSFLFDDSIVNPVGNQAYHNNPMTLFSLSPNPLGSTTFTPATAGASMFYTNGSPTFLTVGGLVDGSSGINGASSYSDFYFTYNIATQSLQNTIYKIDGNTGLGNGGGGTANVQFLVVPEPTTLGAAALSAMALVRRRR